MRIAIAQLTVAVALFSGLVAGRAHAVEVTTCGQSVIGTGDLVADLDCSSHPGLFSLQLIGRLRLNGFSIKGNPARPVIYCNTGTCRVTGSGTIWGGRQGILSDVGATVIDARIVSNAGDGVRAQRSVRILGYADVSFNGGDGVRSNAHVAVVGPGSSSGRTPVVGNGGDGIRADAGVRVKWTTVGGNEGDGIQTAGAVAATDSRINDNGFDGLRGLRVRLIDTTAIRNRSDVACGVDAECADVASVQRPVVAGVSLCETSRRTTSSGDWDVCTTD